MKKVDYQIRHDCIDLFWYFAGDFLKHHPGQKSTYLDALQPLEANEEVRRQQIIWIILSGYQFSM